MRRFLALGAAVLLCFLLPGCKTGNELLMSGQTSEGQREEISRDEDGNWIFEDEIVIGRVAPFTGMLRTFGEGTPYVEESAIRVINERGGVVLDGKRCSLRLVCEDSGSSIKGAQTAAEKLIREGIDIMIVSHTAETVLPVSAVCEREGIACISVDAPASAWIMGGPYSNSWHTFFDNEREMLCFYDAWESVETNKKIGLMTANDNEGIEIRTFIHDFASAKGYAIIDAGAYYIGEEDFSDYINTFAAEDCDIILGVMVADDFQRFWTQLADSGYSPKMCTVAKACLFENDMKRLGNLGDGLITEVWWDSSFPYTSSLDGLTCKELATDYLVHCQPELGDAPATVGFKYANIEILYDILKRSASMDLDAINQAAAQTNLDTIVGHVRFDKKHISVVPCITGQWILDEEGNYHREIVGNYLIPDVKKTAEIKLLEK